MVLKGLLVHVSYFASHRRTFVSRNRMILITEIRELSAQGFLLPERFLI